MAATASLALCVRLRAPGERAGEGECLRALVRRQLHVARRNRQPVLVADRSAARGSRCPRFRSRTTRRSTAACCASFWPKYARSRLDDVEQLHADGRDAAEVAGARRALGAGFVDVDPGAEAGGIHLVCRSARTGRRRLPPPRSPGRAARRADIAARSACSVELRRVHEERGDEDVVLGACGAEERAVAVVERAHRGHEPDDAGELELGDRPDDLHVASASVAPARVS